MKRRGASLNELLVCISLIAALLPLCGKLIWTLAQGHRAQVRWMEQNRDTFRLALQLKTDALAAESIEEVPIPRFINDRAAIEYANVEQGIERRVLKEDMIEHRDHFYFPRGAELSLSSEEKSKQIRAKVTSPSMQDHDARETLLTLLLPVPAAEVAP
jgi:hypothetical protein